MLSSHRILAPVSVVVLLAPSAAAQTVLHHFDGSAVAGDYGSAVDGGGDVNGDGHADLIVGAFRADANRGRIEVRSGLDGSILYDKLGPSADTFFGSTVAFVGDVDADGFDDFAVDSTNKVRVYSGSSGAVIHAFPELGGSFGAAILGADINQDGHADVLVGAPLKYGSAGAQFSGWVYGYSGKTGWQMRSHTGEEHSRLGSQLAHVGDLDGDGAADYAVSAPYHDDGNKGEAGVVRVYSGQDGSEIFSVTGDLHDHRLGWRLSGAGDVNGDGLGDLLATYAVDFANQLEVRILSGAGGATLHTFAGTGGQYAHSLAGAGDVNGDGLDDVIVGAPDWDPQPNAGAIYIHSGADGRLLKKLQGASVGDGFGASVAGAGDVDGDGRSDFVVGAFRDDSYTAEGGSATVFGGVDISVGEPYCTPSVPNSTGLSAGVLATGVDDAASNLFSLSAVRLPAGKAGYFLASQSQGLVMPPGSMGNLCLSGTIGRFASQVQLTGPGGSFWIDVDLTDMPAPLPSTVQAGDTYHFQAWYRDFFGGPTSNFTDGVRVTFQ